MYIQHCTVLLEHLEHLEHYLGTVVGFLPEKGREVSVWDRVEIMKFYTHAPTFIDPCALLIKDRTTEQTYPNGPCSHHAHRGPSLPLCSCASSRFFCSARGVTKVAFARIWRTMRKDMLTPLFRATMLP